jgi:hypothetical protein
MIMGKPPKDFVLGKKLEEFHQEEEAAEAASERQPEGVDFADSTPDPELADEYFGGFKPSEPEDEDEPDDSLKARPVRARVLSTLPPEERGFDLYHQPCPGWAAELPREDIVDGQTPRMCLWLLHRGRWPWWRDGSWAQNCSVRFYWPSEARDRHGVQTRWPQAKRGESKKIDIAGRDYRILAGYVPPPLDKEARPPRPIEPQRATSTQPFPFARLLIEEVDEREWLAALLEADPRRARYSWKWAPFLPELDQQERGFAHGIRCEEFGAFRCDEGDDKETDEPWESIERWDSSERWSRQQWKRPSAWYGGTPWALDWSGPAKYRPSEALEDERFPELERVKTNPLLTKEYLYGEPRPALGSAKRWSRAVALPDRVRKLKPRKQARARVQVPTNPHCTVNEAWLAWFASHLNASVWNTVAPGISLSAWDDRKLQKLPRTEWPEIRSKPCAVRSQPEMRAQGVARAREFFAKPFDAEPFDAELKPTKAELRAYLELEVAKFFAKGGLVTYCPDEMTTRMLVKRGVQTVLHQVTRIGHEIWFTATPFGREIVVKRMGRPRAYEQPMTAAQRKARSRAMQTKTRVPSTRPRPDAIDGHALHRSASGLPTTRRARRKIMHRELSSRVTRSEDNMIHVVGFPTPKGSKPLVGELTITAKPLQKTPVAEAAPQPRHSELPSSPMPAVVELVQHLPVELRVPDQRPGREGVLDSTAILRERHLP